MLHQRHTRTGADHASRHNQAILDHITEQPPAIHEKQPETDFQAFLNENLEMVAVLQICEESHTGINRSENPKSRHHECAYLRHAAGRYRLKLIKNLVKYRQLHPSTRL